MLKILRFVQELSCQSLTLLWKFACPTIKAMVLGVLVIIDYSPSFYIYNGLVPDWDMNVKLFKWRPFREISLFCRLLFFIRFFFPLEQTAYLTEEARSTVRTGAVWRVTYSCTDWDTVTIWKNMLVKNRRSGQKHLPIVKQQPCWFCRLRNWTVFWLLFRFMETAIFFCVKPRSGDKEVTPEYFFSQWSTFCQDFKDQWKREQQRLLKIRWVGLWYRLIVHKRSWTNIDNDFKSLLG